MKRRAGRSLLVAFLVLPLVVLAGACGSESTNTRRDAPPDMVPTFPAMGTQEAKPATGAYPFDRWMKLPAGTQQMSVLEAGSAWVGRFVLPSPSFAAVEALRRQAENAGLDTISISTGWGGFSLHGDIEGLVQVESADATSQTIFIALTKFPK